MPLQIVVRNNELDPARGDICVDIVDPDGEKISPSTILTPSNEKAFYVNANAGARIVVSEVEKIKAEIIEP